MSLSSPLESYLFIFSASGEKFPQTMAFRITVSIEYHQRRSGVMSPVILEFGSFSLSIWCLAKGIRRALDPKIERQVAPRK